MTAQFASPPVAGFQTRPTRERSRSIARAGTRGTVAATLRTLPEGWFVMHDVAWPGRLHVAIDHVVIGPAGVFVVDDKAWSGDIALAFTELRHNGLRRDTVITGAVEAGHAIVRSSPHASPGHVHPVLCFERGAVVTGRSSQVTACTADELATWLVTQPRVLSSREVVQIVVELEDVLAPTAGVGHAEDREVRATPAAVVDRRYPVLPATRTETVRVALALALFVLLLTQPTLVTAGPGWVADWVRSVM